MPILREEQQTTGGPEFSTAITAMGSVARRGPKLVVLVGMSHPAWSRWLETPTPPVTWAGLNAKVWQCRPYLFTFQLWAGWPCVMEISMGKACHQQRHCQWLLLWTTVISPLKKDTSSELCHTPAIEKQRGLALQTALFFAFFMCLWQL